MKFFAILVILFTLYAGLGASAPSNAAPGYLVVIGRTLDRPKMIAYSMTLPPIYGETGGRYIGAGRPGAGVTCFHGHCESRSAVVATWQDSAQIERFWWGDTYRKAVALRDQAGVFTVVGVKGESGVGPYAAGGALLIATTAGQAGDGAMRVWIDAALATGARLLARHEKDALISLEGDAMFDRLVLLNFATKGQRDVFVADKATKLLVADASSGFLLSLLAVDAPAAPPTNPSPATSTK